MSNGKNRDVILYQFGALNRLYWFCIWTPLYTVDNMIAFISFQE